jgi:hypothetical protein
MKQEPTPPEPKPEGQGAGAPETPPTLMVLLVDSPVAEHDEQRAERTARASRQCDVHLVRKTAEGTRAAEFAHFHRAATVRRDGDHLLRSVIQLPSVPNSTRPILGGTGQGARMTTQPASPRPTVSNTVDPFQRKHT